MNWELTKFIVDTVLAICAIGGVVFASLTFRQAKKFKEQDARSRIAYFSPAERLGYFVDNGKKGFNGKNFDFITEDLNVMLIILKNYGQNPVEYAKGELYIFRETQNASGISPEDLMYKAIHIDISNPLAPGQEWYIFRTLEQFESDGVDFDSRSRMKYFLLHVEYKDAVTDLDCWEDFCWRKGLTGYLEGVDLYTRNRLQWSVVQLQKAKAV